MKCPYCGADDIHHFIGQCYVCNACGREFLDCGIEEPNTPRIDKDSVRNVARLERWDE